MSKSLHIKSKYFIFVVLIIVLHLAVALLSIHFYNVYQANGDNRRIKECIASGIIDEDELAGISFNYELEYTLQDESKKQFSGNEIYYWDGHKLVSVSEFMKGYE